MSMKKEHRTSLPRRHSWALAFFLIAYLCAAALAAVPMITSATAAPAPMSQSSKSKPQHKAVFEELFAKPDWEALYTMAGIQDTVFENAATYKAYMEAKVGAQPLTHQEIVTELPNSRRWLVFLGDEKIAAFTMTEDPQWALSGVELFFQRTHSVTIEKQPEHTVYINGVALTDSHTIHTLETIAERHLPEGVHGYLAHWQRVDGLLLQPDIAVLDENGQKVPMEQDPQTGIFRPVRQVQGEMTEAEASTIRKAAITDAKYSAGYLTTTQLKTYFDNTTALYKQITNTARGNQKSNGCSVDEDAIVLSEFYRYNDKLFSVNVKLTLKVTRTDNTIKVYNVDRTYFFRSNADGVYRVIAYTNESAIQSLEQVRLTFAMGEELVTQMADAAAIHLTPPEITPPEGQILVGWATKSDIVDGVITMTVRLLPDGTVLGGLEPMTLYPVFQAA